MRASEVMIAWTPLRWASEGPKSHTIGQVKVGPWPDPNRWSYEYAMSVGACFSKFRNASREKQAIILMSDVLGMIMRDKIDPEVAHKELLKIDEYRWLIPRDTPGAEDEPDGYLVVED